MVLKRSALPTTDTELKLMAAAAIIGLSSRCCRDRVQHAGRNRHAQGVVDQGEEEVLADVPHRVATELHGLHDAPQVAFDQRDARRFNRHVGAGSHCDPDIGFGQGGSVVDAVARHRHLAALGSQRLDPLVLVLRSNPGVELVDPQLLGDGLGRLLVVAGEHDDPQAQVVQGFAPPPASMP